LKYLQRSSDRDSGGRGGDKKRRGGAQISLEERGKKKPHMSKAPSSPKNHGQKTRETKKNTLCPVVETWGRGGGGGTELTVDAQTTRGVEGGKSLKSRLDQEGGFQKNHWVGERRIVPRMGGTGGGVCKEGGRKVEYGDLQLGE